MTPRNDGERLEMTRDAGSGHGRGVRRMLEASGDLADSRDLGCVEAYEETR